MCHADKYFWSICSDCSKVVCTFGKITKILTLIAMRYSILWRINGSIKSFFAFDQFNISWSLIYRIIKSVVVSYFFLCSVSKISTNKFSTNYEVLKWDVTDKSQGIEKKSFQCWKHFYNNIFLYIYVNIKWYFAKITVHLVLLVTRFPLARRTPLRWKKHGLVLSELCLTAVIFLMSSECHILLQYV